ncbi:MAG: nuclear transport factor 2 family protein, partial [Parahaliea sp.]
MRRLLLLVAMIATPLAPATSSDYGPPATLAALLADYGWHADRHDIDAISALFTDDASPHTSGSTLPAEGSEAIRTFFIAAWKRSGTSLQRRHLITGIRSRNEGTRQRFAATF